MFLKSLTLKGFKSFADSTVMEMEPGVTVVVGPNGSGKSNVVDAIAWVLGAQAPSSVRSQKMEDVIFNGTSKRSPLGRAEVMLTLDNSAGLLPLDFTEITVSRTLFRNGDSEYAINGVECRLLDVQELLSDAGVGRQQHVIISQGQIDAVLTARAEDRRAIIEEAAGILKYRKRKEKAERRLEATEANLLRVQDLIREVRRQLRPLERQAEAARRYEEVVGELRALRLYLSGREVAGLREKLAQLEAEKAGSDTSERELRELMNTLEVDVRTAEEELAARGASGLNDELMKVEQLRERARGLVAVIAERRRSMERDQGQLIAEDVVAALEADAAEMREDLAEVERGLTIAISESDALQVEEDAFERERTEQGLFHTVQGNEASTAAAEVRGELRTLRNTVEQGAGEIQKLQARIEQIENRDNSFVGTIEGLQAELTQAEAAVGTLRSELATAEGERNAAETAGDVAQQGRAVAERRAARASARLEALEAAMASTRARTGAEHLAQIEGVVGALVDLLDIDQGWDAAVKAALGDTLASIVVSNPVSARRAIDQLRNVDHNGAVIALGLHRGAAGSLPSGVESVRSHVRPASGAPDQLGALLDSLLSSVGCSNDIAGAIDIVEANSNAVVVTRRGDKLAPSGWRLGAADEVGSIEVIEETRAEVEAATAELQALDAEVENQRKLLVAARTRINETQTKLDRQVRAVEAANERLAKTTNDRRSNGAEREMTLGSLDDIRGRIDGYQQRVSELEGLLPALEDAEAAEIAAAKAQGEARAAIDSKAAHMAMRRKDLEVRLAGLRERDQFLKQRLEETDRRLEVDTAARAEAGVRRQRIEASLLAITRLGDLVEGHRVAAESRLAELYEMRRRQSDEVREITTRLDVARRGRTEAEQQLEALRERGRRVDVEEAETRMRLEAAIDLIRRELEVEPEEAEAAPMPEVAEGVDHADRARALERDIRLMGPINPLALQEFTELQERHTFLEEQLNDVRNSRRELAQVIAAIDEEIQTVFAKAFEDVSKNFTDLFQLLFPGGKGKLALTSPGDMLNTGIEVEATPPGKTFKKLSLLSGGERSLTALAYLFAVFRSRPSPFYVMDEVEAALDDVNLHRFLGLVQEFRRDAQLIIVSHQKRTMEAADCLLGVSMQPGGSSKVVSGAREQYRRELVMLASSTINIVIPVAVLVLLSGGIVLTKKSRIAKPESAEASGSSSETRTSAKVSESAPPQADSSVPTQESSAGDAAVSEVSTTDAAWAEPDSETLEPAKSDELGVGPTAAPVEAVVEETTVKAKAGRTRSLFANAFQSIRGRGSLDAAAWDELEETLLRADIGIGLTTRLLDPLRASAKAGTIRTPDDAINALREAMTAQLATTDRSLHLDADKKPNVWLFVGVNGVGKTTTIGKIGTAQTALGTTVLMAAGDTFRAAAAEQLHVWAERCGASYVRGAEGGDPASVIFDGIQSASAKGIDLVLGDTAGRLQNKSNLMEELKKVRRVAAKAEGTVNEVLLVIDATTGQNGLSQAREFAAATDVTGVVLTKLDGSAKGGIVFAIETDLGIPVKLVGLGEGAHDLVTFDPAEYVTALFE